MTTAASVGDASPHQLLGISERSVRIATAPSSRCSDGDVQWGCKGREPFMVVHHDRDHICKFNAQLNCDTGRANLG